MRPGFKKFLAIILVLFFIGYLAVTGIADLINTKDVQTVTIDECVSFLDIEHSINGLIPVGTDHYYLGVNDETMEACVIKASKRWHNKNFDADGHALMEDGLTVTALCKKAGDVFCKPLLEKVAKQKWTTLHVQNGQCCNRTPQHMITPG